MVEEILTAIMEFIMINDERFMRLVKELMQDEGIHSNDPDDPGGDTWFGITRRSYPNIPWPPTLDQAKEIYYWDWWLKGHYYLINDDELAGEILDLAANMGNIQCIKLLQRAVNKTGAGPGILTDPPLIVDGSIGPVTAQAVNDHPNIWWLTDRFRLEAIKFYHGLHKSKFLASWVGRTIQ